MTDQEIIVGIVLEEGSLTLEQLAVACAVEPGWVLHRVDEGLIPATSGSGTEWRFTSAALRRARRMREIEHAYEAVPELAALVADMLEEMDALRSRLRRAGRG
jgi:chaperone modulatory protein CbpM